jgi:hypothetical protein
MNEVLDRIERELMDAVARRVARRRARRRSLLLAALLAGLLLLASLASAVSGVGPAGGLFASDEGLPSSRQPEPGGRRALLHAGGGGAAGWDLLVYRSERPRVVLAGRVKPYCLALVRGDAKPIPGGGIEGPPKPSDVYGGSTQCEYPRTLAARVRRQGIEFHGGGIVQPEAPSPTTPYYGLVLAEAERVEIQREGEDSVEARLSRPFKLEVPRLPLRVRRQIESPRQMRLTAGVPRFVRVRAFVAALDSRQTPVGERTSVVSATASFADGSSRTATLGGRRVLPLPQPPQLEPHRSGAVTRLEGVAPDGARWRAIAFKTRDGAICAGSAKAPAPPYRGDLICGGGFGVVGALVKRGIISELGTGLPDGKRPPGSYTIFGHTRADVRKVVFARRGTRPVPAQLSPPWTTVRWHERELRSVVSPRLRRRLRSLPRTVSVRLFMVVVPPGVHGLQPRLELKDGRVVRPFR